MPQLEDPAALIAEGVALADRIAVDSKREKEIKARLLELLPPGKHEGNDGTACTVVAPAPSVKPSAEDAETVRELVGDDVFKKLFELVKSWKPLKEFRGRLEALADKRTASKVLALVEKDSTPYVKWA